MDNPAYYTVVRRWKDFGPSSVYGLFPSREAAAAEAVVRRRQSPEAFHDVAIVTLLNPDPASGITLSQLRPPNTDGFILASLTTANPDHRFIEGPVLTEERAIVLAGKCRADHTGRGVFDVAALTITDHDPAGAVPKEAHTS
jgi:hypothetical protein